MSLHRVMRWRYLSFLAFVRCLTPSRRPHHSITWTTADGSRVIDGVQSGELLRTALLRRGLSPHNNNSQLINCRGLGTCGTCAVEVRGAVEPAEASARERLRLSFPPHELRPNLRLACQCVVRGDVVVSKFEGFWGARSTLAPAAANAKTYFGELEFLLDRRTPPTAELRPLANDALNDLGWRLRDLGGVVQREVERALRDGPCEVCNGTEVVGCPNCDGQGYYVSYGMETECKACRGSGQVVCRACFRGDPWDLGAVRERARRRPD
jgi:ferredoxin